MNVFLPLTLLFISGFLNAQTGLDTLFYKNNTAVYSSIIKRDFRFYCIHLSHEYSNAGSPDFKAFEKQLKSMKGIYKSYGGRTYDGIYFWDSKEVSVKQIKWYLNYFENSKWIVNLTRPIEYPQHNSLGNYIDIGTPRTTLIPRNNLVRVVFNPSKAFIKESKNGNSDFERFIWFHKRGFRILNRDSQGGITIVPIAKVESDSFPNLLRNLVQETAITSLWYDIYYPIELE